MWRVRDPVACQHWCLFVIADKLSHFNSGVWLVSQTYPLINTAYYSLVSPYSFINNFNLRKIFKFYYKQTRENDSILWDDCAAAMN